MSDAAQRRAPLLEVRLHALSPFAPVLNGILASALLYGVYLALALNFGPTVIETTAESVDLDGGAWAALIMSLIFGAAITMPALTHGQWRVALTDLKLVLDEPGRRKVEEMAQGPLRTYGVRGVAAFVIGALAGIGLNAWLLNMTSLTLDGYFVSVRPWFDIVNPLLFGLGARAGVLLNREDRDMKALVADHLEVDLARLDRHQVFGRLASRNALSWLVLTAVILLFFVGSAPAIVSGGTVVLALLASGYAFAVTTGPVVRKTSQARDAALQSVRERIREAGRALASEAQAPTGAPIADLIAYESWLMQRPTWPITAPVTRRLALYGFIPVLAWFGAAAAEMVLDRIA